MIDLNKVCRELERQTCKTHLERPKAVAVGQSIDLTTCCDSFREKLEKQIDIEVGKQLDNSIDDIFKGL